MFNNFKPAIAAIQMCQNTEYNLGPDLFYSHNASLLYGMVYFQVVKFAIKLF